MGVEEILCMNGGTGKTSYALNSFVQKAAMEKVRPLLEESIRALCDIPNLDRLTVADLGCSSGPNALAVLQSIIDVVVSTRKGMGLRIPEFEVFMNDLPNNDFNTIFRSFSGFYKKICEETGVEISCFISGTPGSFYGRLFPCKSIHFLNSSYSLHWFSQVPKGLIGEDGKEALNKGCIYGRKGCPPRVLQAYREQFAKDFTLFLRCRSKEIVHGGRMLLTFGCSLDEEMAVAIEVVSEALNKLAHEGLIDKEKLDSFNLPYYRATTEQVTQLIEAEGSFLIHELDTIDIPLDEIVARKEYVENNGHEDVHLSMVSRLVASTVRVVLEPLLASEFGEDIMDDLFRLVEEMATIILTKTEGKTSSFNHVVSLIRKG